MVQEHWSDDEIIAARPPKNTVDPYRPYAYLVEPECQSSGQIEDVATIFLTNRECPFRCLMCDLWKNTTDSRVPAGAIPHQIAFAFQELAAGATTAAFRHVKLYNSGNFFDRQAIPSEDYGAICEHLADLDTVIVENHPALCGDACRRFQEMLNGRLEIAIGLETIEPHVLKRLNKRMTVADFERAVRFLTRHNMRVRAFILLRPPFMSEQQGLEWALKSVEFAFDVGVECCAIIPTRGGNGAIDSLAEEGHFQPPTLATLEAALECGLAMNRGRVFVDLWDIEKLWSCTKCGRQRSDRLQTMNLTQRVIAPLRCGCQTGPDTA